MNNKEHINKCLALAEKLQNYHAPQVESSFSERVKPILNSPKSKNFLIRLMDVAFRSKDYAKTSDYVLDLFDKYPEHGRIFSAFEKILVGLYKTIGRFFPGISIPLMHKQVMQVTGPILFFVGDSKFKKHAKRREKEDVKLNVNLIGEALIGEQEAADRIVNYKSLLNQADVNYISIKISTIYSQISSLAFEHTVDTLIEKLSEIYDELLAIEARTGEKKFVNLDMEEYRDLELTIATFTKTLSLEKYKDLYAGIVLQAYLPDSYLELKKLIDWAKNRTNTGGAPIKIRVVKGANMEMEKTESSMEDWPLATYSEKVDSDANYKKMISELLTSENLKAVHLGVASHNIFDLSYALQIVNEHGLHEFVDFEMLEGMANNTVFALLAEKANVLLYTPIVKPENYNSAIAYLVRRLDEGTQDGNFLKEGLELKVGTPKWESLKQQFLASVERMETVKEGPNRHQNRLSQSPVVQEHFENVANTDWTLPANRIWLHEIKEKWQNGAELKEVPVIGGADLEINRTKNQQENWQGVSTWTYTLATAADYQHFLNQEDTWFTKTIAERAELLRLAAVEIEKNRGDLIGVAVAELGKTFQEVDVEVSEAIDFANFYAANILDYQQKMSFETISGVNLVLSPWNFPVAIPIGGVLASLAAGKRVILKPSTNAAATGYLISKCLWDAGVPTSAFAFLPTEESVLDEFLAEGKTFDAVILTGATDTAKFLLNRNPHLNLYAETGGKNATIVSALSDREQAIKNVVQSAFGNAGQKCSATSLLILEEELFNDAQIKEILLDATQSKPYGSPWDFETMIGPLAVPISEKLAHVLENTPEDKWLLKPTLKGRFFLSPGIIWGVEPADYTYQNELFGPILSVMKASSIEHAIELANGVAYGLTSGLETLDEDEVNLWRSQIQAGNLYVNRATTGAIVLRQPFGGIKASCFGFGMKAGGRNYVLQFMHPVNKEMPLDEIKKNYEHSVKAQFDQTTDECQIRGQINESSYLKPVKIYALIDAQVAQYDKTCLIHAAKAIGCDLEFIRLKSGIVTADRELDTWTDLMPEITYGTVVRALNYERLPAEFLKACHDQAIHVYARPPHYLGEVELLNYYQEQSFSYSFHRYGNLLGKK